MFLMPNCSPTCRASCRDFQRNTLIFSAVLMFQTFESQSLSAIELAGRALFFSSITVRYPDLVEYSPLLFFNHTKSSGILLVLGFNFRICSLCAGRMESIFGISHSVVPGISKSATFTERRASGAGPYGLSCSE